MSTTQLVVFARRGLLAQGRRFHALMAMAASAIITLAVTFALLTVSPTV